MHDPSTIAVKPQKFNPQIKLLYQDSQNFSPQNIHALRYTKYLKSVELGRNLLYSRKFLEELNIGDW